MADFIERGTSRLETTDGSILLKYDLGSKVGKESEDDLRGLSIVLDELGSSVSKTDQQDVCLDRFEEEWQGAKEVFEFTAKPWHL
jgi:hypothetical protein